MEVWNQLKSRSSTSRSESRRGIPPHRRLITLFALSILAGLVTLSACVSGGRSDTSVESARAAAVTAGVEAVETDDDEHEADEHEAEEHETDEQEVDEHEADEHEPEDSLAEGRSVFLSVGCATCHGQDALGTSIAPGLPGHIEAQIREQVRSPRTGSVMPAFSESQLSDGDLAALVAYITSLEGDGHLHQEPADIDATVSMHHWMAISAVKAENVEEALHHLDHIIDLVDGDHLAAMNEIDEQLRSGDLHDAEHGIESMLVGAAEMDLGMDQLHLELALQSLAIENATEVEHHITHFMETADDDESELANGVIDDVKAGRYHETEDALHELLEMAHDEHE